MEKAKEPHGKPDEVLKIPPAEAAPREPAADPSILALIHATGGGCQVTEITFGAAPGTSLMFIRLKFEDHPTN